MKMVGHIRLRLNDFYVMYTKKEEKTKKQQKVHDLK
jgi:hypothetical protein